MARGLDNERQTYNGMPLESLTCFGCTHSAAAEPWPGQPSGERPCMFCIRNPLRAVLDKYNDEPRWYDGGAPVTNPMDCYHSLDMADQFAVWLREAETNGAEALNRLIDLRVKLGGSNGSH